MIEDDVLEALDALIDAIRSSDMYAHYRGSSAALTARPDLFRQVMDFRRQTIEIYHNSEAGDLAENTDRLESRYAELQSIPEVCEFLEAEETMVQMLKIIDRRVYGCVGLHMPGE